MTKKPTITDDTWPHHPDGRRKKLGEMTTQQQEAVVRGAVARLSPAFVAQGIELKFKGEKS